MESNQTQNLKQEVVMDIKKTMEDVKEETQGKTQEKEPDRYKGKKMDWTKLSIFRKMAIASYRLSKRITKKSGYNSELDYWYFKLEDISGPIYDLGDEMGYFPKFDHCIDEKTGEPLYRLQVINLDNPEDHLEWKTPLKMVEITGGNQMQAYGAVVTYARRMLFCDAFGITEEEQLDRRQSKTTETVPFVPQPVIEVKPAIVPQTNEKIDEEKAKKQKFYNQYFATVKELCDNPKTKDEVTRYLKEDLGLSSANQAFEKFDEEKLVAITKTLYEIKAKAISEEKETQDDFIDDNADAIEF